MRTHKSELSAAQYQAQLVQTIREEYEHNLSQQVYVSLQAWEILKNAKEEIIILVNTAAAKAGESATATHLSNKIFELYLSAEKNLCRTAIDFLKNEIRQTF